MNDFLEKVKARFDAAGEKPNEPTDEDMRFIRWAMESEHDDIADRAFRPKVLWFDTDGIMRLELFPHVDEADGGDWVGALAWPCLVLSAAMENISHVAVVSDSIGTTSQTKADGTDWEHGDMQRALHDHNENFPLVHELLMVTTVRPDGTVCSVTAPYDRDGDKITYEEPKGWSTNAGLDYEAMPMGRVPDQLRYALRGPKLTEAMRDIVGNLGLTDEQAAIHALCIAVKMVMHEVHWQVLLGAKTETEVEIIKVSMSEGPMSEGIRAFDEDAIEELVSIQESWDLPDHEKGDTDA